MAYCRFCSYCKKVRDDRGCWDRVETDISRHADVHFSHGICPECMREHFPDIDPDAPE